VDLFGKIVDLFYKSVDLLNEIDDIFSKIMAGFLNRFLALKLKNFDF